VEGENDGTGPAGTFSITVGANVSDALIGQTVGAGAAGSFKNTSAGPTTTEDGVDASSLGMSRWASAVYAVGNIAAPPGLPKAAALTVKGGVDVAGPLVNRPSGTIMVPPPPFPWFAMNSCDNTFAVPAHFHKIGFYTDIGLSNNLIIAGAADPAVPGLPPPPGAFNVNRSIILATVETVGMPPPQTSYYVQVHSVAPGSCVFRVTRMATPDSAACPPPADSVFIHYLIINPLL
jgi:hypothetical protein